MTILDRVNALNNLVESSFKNGMNTIETIHRTTAEMPLEVLKEFGFPEDKIETARESHRRILRVLYGGICNAQEEFGKLAVLQVTGLTNFIGDMAGAGNWSPPAGAKKPAADKTKTKTKARKTTKRAAKKSTVKKAPDIEPDNGQAI